MRGAMGIAHALRDRDIPIGVIGIPKTIDNDIPGQSFGFVTAFSAAARSINIAEIEARAALGSVGLVKVMGRHSGFMACYAALANHIADLVLIPKVPFGLDRLLRTAGPSRCTRGHGWPYGHGGWAQAQPFHPYTDRACDLRAQSDGAR